MKKIAVAFFLCGFFAAFSQSKNLPAGYGGVNLGMSIEETKRGLKKILILVIMETVMFPFCQMKIAL